MTPSLKLNMMRDQAQRNISLSADYADYVKHHAVLCMVLNVARTTHTSPVDHAVLDELQHEIDMYLAEVQKRHAWKTGADMLCPVVSVKDTENGRFLLRGYR